MRVWRVDVMKMTTSSGVVIGRQGKNARCKLELTSYCFDVFLFLFENVILDIKAEPVSILYTCTCVACIVAKWRHSFFVLPYFISYAYVVILLPPANQPVPDKQIQCKDVRISNQTFDVALDAQWGQGQIDKLYILFIDSTGIYVTMYLTAPRSRTRGRNDWIHSYRTSIIVVDGSG